MYALQLKQMFAGNKYMEPKEFKLALVQMEVRGGDKAWNIRHAVELVSEAASSGADVAVLPECMDLGWTHPASLTMAERIPDGEACKALMRVARAKAIYICSGLTEKSGNQRFNSAVIIDKHGKMLCKHRKLNELNIGHTYYAQGDRLNVVNTEFGTFGLMICADGFAKDHVLARSLCYMGADVILSPSAWAVAADHDNTKEPYGDSWRNSYIPVAREFSTAIFGVSNVGSITDGPWKGRKCIGCSLAIDPSGKEILQGPYGIDAECILYIDVKPIQRPARGTGWGDFWKQMGSEQGAAADADKPRR
jgi:predicted amidohydrolase